MRRCSARRGVVIGSAILLGTALSVGHASAAGNGYKVLWSFTSDSHGVVPTFGAPAVDSDGSVYGSTEGGGHGCGVWFRKDPGVSPDVIRFHGDDGCIPAGEATYDESRSLSFGTTNQGGSFNCSSGCGTVYSVTVGPNFWNVLHYFNGTTDGSNPNDAPVWDAAGNLYGTAQTGGAGNLGTVWKYDNSDGSLAPLHVFNGTDGQSPIARLLIDSKGNLFGMTPFGGSNGMGVVFEIPASGGFVKLHDFAGGDSDGANPDGFLIEDSGGNLYGDTNGGGPDGGGVVFKLSRNGDFSLLATFSQSDSTKGTLPTGNLVLVRSTLYGTASYGGDPNCQCGTVFAVSKKGGAVTVLHTFTGSAGKTDGENPLGLTLGPDNYLYGVTEFGGKDFDGTIFRLKAHA